MVVALHLAFDRLHLQVVAGLHPEQGQLATVGPEVGAEDPVDHHRVAAGRTGAAEEGDLGALGGDAQLEPGRPGQRVDPGPAGQHDRVGRDPAVVGVDPDHPVAGHGQPAHGHPLADPRPQVDRPRGEGEGRGHRVGVARAGSTAAISTPVSSSSGCSAARSLGLTASVSTPTRRSMATFRSSRPPSPGPTRMAAPVTVNPHHPPTRSRQFWK